MQDISGIPQSSTLEQIISGIPQSSTLEQVTSGIPQSSTLEQVISGTSIPRQFVPCRNYQKRARARTRVLREDGLGLSRSLRGVCKLGIWDIFLNNTSHGMCGASPVEFEVKFPRKQFPWLVRSHQVEFVVNYPVSQLPWLMRSPT